MTTANPKPSRPQRHPAADAVKSGQTSRGAKPAQKRVMSPQAANVTVQHLATPSGKTGLLVALLTQPDGMTIAQAMAATGWQAHSVRGALAGSIGKRLGMKVTSEKTDGPRVYRIAAEPMR